MSVTAGFSPFDRAASARHRPPRDCPVCSHRLDVTQLGCPSCGTGLTGRFQPCEFCGLDDADRDVLRVFLASRGNMKDLERHLGVSYPTARSRFDDLLRKLDLVAGGTARTEAGAATPTAPVTDAPRDVDATPGPGAADDPRLAALRALASGDLDVDDARRRIAGGRPSAGSALTDDV
jgi:hypothetical protein